MCDWAYPSFGAPTPGLRDALELLREGGYRIAVWSARFDRSMYTAAERTKSLYDIRQWLARHHIQVDEIDTGGDGKRVAGAYIDDKGITFNGDWQDVLQQLEIMRARELGREERTRKVYEDE